MSEFVFCKDTRKKKTIFRFENKVVSIKKVRTKNIFLLMVWCLTLPATVKLKNRASVVTVHRPSAAAWQFGCGGDVCVFPLFETRHLIIRVNSRSEQRAQVGS